MEVPGQVLHLLWSLHQLQRTAGNRNARRAQQAQKVSRFLCIYGLNFRFHGASSQDVQMSWLFLLFLAFAFLLTKICTIGNTQTNGKNPPTPLIRNASSRDINGGKPVTASSHTAGRPSAIDPLSIVCTPHFSLQATDTNLGLQIDIYINGSLMLRNSIFSRGQIPRTQYHRSSATLLVRRARILMLGAQSVLR